MESNKNLIFENPEGYFNKYHAITTNCSLSKAPFQSKKWSISVFQFNKNYLNSIKAKLNDFDLELWSKHTRNTDPSSFIISILRRSFHIELLTQAWCKFYECLNQFDLVPYNITDKKTFHSVHICEAPGAFVCALNHFLHLNYPLVKWKWMANTLNPNYEGNSPSKMVDDDRLIQSTRENWHFGADGSGDITKYYNHKSLVKSAEDMGPIHLVTADGSINCMENPGEQEIIVEHLHYCEMMTALKILSPGGNFLLKIFTMFEESTISHIYLLKSVFKQVHFFKPSTSKSGNSEVYIICLNYYKKAELMNFWNELIAPYKSTTKNDKAMFAKSEINVAFLREITQISEFYMNKQINTIKRNISTFTNKQSSDDFRKLKELKNKFAEVFFDTYHVSDIPKYKRVVPEINITNYWSKRKISTEMYSGLNCEWIYCNELLNLDNLSSFLSIKTGRQIDRLYSSKFCTVELLVQLKQYIYSNSVNTIIDLTEFDLPKNTEVFHKTAFDFSVDFNHTLFTAVWDILCKSKKDLAFVGFPFVTTFSVGFLFLLALGYKKVTFYKRGVVLLSDIADFKKTFFGLHELSKTFQRIERNQSVFKTDIIQVVPYSYIQKTNFFEALCNYNENFSKSLS